MMDRAAAASREFRKTNEDRAFADPIRINLIDLVQRAAYSQARIFLLEAADFALSDE